jgi:serine/threonine protein kinase
MLLLPKKIGSFTLHRKLGTGGVAESYVGTHDTNAGRPVVVRRVLPYVQRDPARLASIEGRVKDLLGVRHPFLVHVIESFAEGEEHYIVEEHIDGVNLDKVLSWCRQNQRQVPHNVFLNIATQVCNGLEALHGRAGKGTSAEHVLHLALKPGAIFVTRDGKVMVGSYGLTRSPTTLPHGGVAGPVPTRMEYLSPEQTHPDQKLTPSSDIFALGALLYELLTLDSLFRADSNLQTIHRVRRAEVTSQLLRVKELMPGLDKVLYRALSLNPRHRYQRAFVLREDLRGLMAGYSFATIAEDTRTFLAPLLEQIGLDKAMSVVDAAPDAPANADSFNETPITHVDLDPMGTASAAAVNLAERVARLKAQNEGEEYYTESTSEHTEHTSPRGDDPPTEVLRTIEEARPEHEDLDRPTLPGLDESTLVVESPRRAPPDPTVSSPDIGRMPPPAPVQLAAARALPAPSAGLEPVPENTAAYIAREAPLLPNPNDTAAFIAREAPPVPPPAPPPVLPAPAAGPAMSRPMPGPTLSRPMPPPAPPRPVAASPSPTLSPDALPAPVVPVAAVAPTPPVAPPTIVPPLVTPRYVEPVSPSPFDDPEPPPPSGRSWIVVGGAVVALVAVFGCAGAGWMAWASYNAGTSTGELAVVAPPAAAPPVAAAPSDAASVMADAAPPRLEPIEDDAAAVAAAEIATPPAVPPPAPVAAVAPTPTPAPTPAPAASTRAPTPVAASTPAPSSSRSTSTASAPASTSSRSSTSSSPSTSSGSSTRVAVASAPPATTTRAPTSTSSSSPSSSSSSSSSSSRSTSGSTVPAASTAKAETSRPSTTSRSAPPAATFEAPVDVSVEEAPVSDLDQYVDAAKKGKLQSTDATVLEMVDISEPQYSRARALLLMNAQHKGDDKGTRKYLDQLMLLPENQYNPVYLTDYARWHVNHAEYDKALDKASLAERYWARIPPELVFSKKAEIYEIQAAAYQGRFYKSGEDLELLGSAIKGWERYRQHVTTKSRTDLQKRADAELARLQDIREKLQ